MYAFEARSSLLERVREKAREAALSNIVAVLSDSSKPSIDLPDKSVDIILVYDVMHEIDDRRGLLQELIECLKGMVFSQYFQCIWEQRILLMS